MPVLLICLAHLLGNITFVLFLVPVALWVGAGIVDVGIFMRPRLYTVRLGRLRICLNSIPLGSYVRLQERRIPVDPEDADDKISIPGRDYEDLHPAKQVLILLSPSLGLVVVAILLLGPGRAMASFCALFMQSWWMLTGSLATGKGLVSEVVETARVAPTAEFLGLAASKFAASHILPIPLFNGFHILWILFHLGRKPGLSRQSDSWSMAGLLIVLVAIVRVIVAVVQYCCA